METLKGFNQFIEESEGPEEEFEEGKPGFRGA